ncbi:xanthohumol 4-O-methyltransferase-like [Camellia sinensis]|uniref:xanthohumol 4-O-methyltransferase-like n=1 Tax=Camellia sinensis TaxID=4442 RepID=UPI0010360447|nr:xanthohumol 4-O-methyltransferase-like [Camellia sinensis]
MALKEAMHSAIAATKKQISVNSTHTHRDRERMANEAEAMLRGQTKIWQCIYHFVDSIALKCALDLGVAYINQARGCPITLSQIANDVASSPWLDFAHLSRLMRFLVHKKLFDATNPQSDSDSEEETLYNFNHCSKWLLRNPQQLTLAPLLCLLSIQEGGNAFHMAHEGELWDFASIDPELNKVFNDGMECTAKITIKALISEYKHGFDYIGSLVDVAGGIGASIVEIVKAYAHIKGTNFDLPQVVATAPP